MLSQRYKIAVRRHLGVPFAGTAQAGRLFGWRFAIHVEDLEWKMSNLQPNEEQLITGHAVGSWSVYDQPSVGDVLTFNVIDNAGTHAVDYTVTSQDLNPKQNLVNPAEGTVTFSVALNAAAKINQQLGGLGYLAAASSPADIPSPPYFSPFFAEVTITGPSSTVFSISSSVVGTTNLTVAEPVYPSPIAQIINGVQLYGYVPILDALENRISSADLTLWIQKADVVGFRPDEVTARVQLYRTMCESLARDMGGKEYVERLTHFTGGGGGGAVA